MEKLIYICENSICENSKCCYGCTDICPDSIQSSELGYKKCVDARMCESFNLKPEIECIATMNYVNDKEVVS